jgi:Flp pilus assembly protein TadG
MRHPHDRTAERTARRDTAADRRTSTGGRDPRDEGRISLFLLVIFLAFTLLAGFTTDLGRVLHANARASDLAAKAARAGAQKLDPASLRAGGDQLDPAAARRAALDYLRDWQADTPAGAAVSGTAQADPGQVSVTVTWPVRFWLLAALRPSATVTQTRAATPATGP